ncbi:MAG: flagellar biosynthetic protein FliO [Oscillospiraceae bacterium]|jgi:flagellar protein FliO/FliZ|nr:flagellar biosynthetic protein FliO [Oscillospiraceae bacterium]
MGFLDILSLLGSVLLIVAVLVLTYYASRWYARRMGAGGPGKYVGVVDKTALGQGSAVYIVKVGGKYYMLGVGDKSVSMLCELADFEETAQPGAVPDVPFRQVMRGFMDKTGLSKKKEDDGEN